MSGLIPQIFLFCAIFFNIRFFTGVGAGEERGAAKAREETIVFCMEQSQQCKAGYNNLEPGGKNQ